MDERFYLEKAQEAEALADAAFSEMLRYQWEKVAAQYRQLAHRAANFKRQDSMNMPPQQIVRDAGPPV